MTWDIRPEADASSYFTAPGLAEIADQTLFSMGVGVEAQFNYYYFIRGHLGFPMVDGVTQTTRDPAIYLGITRSW